MVATRDEVKALPPPAEGLSHFSLDSCGTARYTPAASVCLCSSIRNVIVTGVNPSRLPLPFIILLAICLLPAGCVRRRMTIRTNPPGAVAFVDKQRIGVTPVSAPFTYYGTRNIRLMKDGFEPLVVNQRFSVPWYELPPLDFIAENLWPRETRDEQVVEFQLIPQRVVPNEELLDRAEMLRGNTQADHVTPLWVPPAEQLPAPAALPPNQPQLPAPDSRRLVTPNP